MRSCVIVLRSIQQFELPAKYNNKQYNPTNTHILFIFIMAAPIKSRKALFGDPATATRMFLLYFIFILLVFNVIHLACDEEMLRLVASDVIGEKIFEQEAQSMFVVIVFFFS